jgi:hypothetical protein
MGIKKTSQRRETAAQRLQMVQQFRKSGLTRRAFSDRYGVPVATLSWWLKKAKRTSNMPVPITFHEVKLAVPETYPSNTWAMEIIGSSDVIIRCREALSIADLIQLAGGRQC